MSKLTLEDAISHCLEVAEQNETQADKIGRQFIGSAMDKRATNCRECAADHRQLAEWLTELKELKNTIGAVKLSNMKEALELIRKYKAENSNLKAFITSIYQILGEHFEYPCSNEVVAELMKERSTCFDCGGKINNEECWRRYFTTMIGEDEDENS